VVPVVMDLYHSSELSAASDLLTKVVY
jgi:hypothetical protein